MKIQFLTNHVNENISRFNLEAFGYSIYGPHELQTFRTTQVTSNKVHPLAKLHQRNYFETLLSSKLLPNYKLLPGDPLYSRALSEISRST